MTSENYRQLLNKEFEDQELTKDNKKDKQAFAIHSVSERTFIVEEKVAGTCCWESLSVEFDNIEQAKHFFNRHYEKYSENIRLVEVYAR